MNYIELSKEDAHNETIRLAKKIQADFSPDLVVFVATGAYQIGMDLGDFFHVPVMEIFAKRKSNKLKQFISPFLKCIPSGLKKRLRAFEIKSDVHASHSDRNVYWGRIPVGIAEKEFKNIILADDACDTGNTFKQCVEIIKCTYPQASIKAAAINVFSDSFSVFHTDFYLYKDYMISGPWSNDSAGHSLFLKEYETKWMRKEENLNG